MSWPLPEEMSEPDLERRLFAADAVSAKPPSKALSSFTISYSLLKEFCKLPLEIQPLQCQALQFGISAQAHQRLSVIIRNQAMLVWRYVEQEICSSLSGLLIQVQ